MRVRERPKPDDEPVISQVSCFLGVVTVVAMVGGFDWLGYDDLKGIDPGNWGYNKNLFRSPIRSRYGFYMLQAFRISMESLQRLICMLRC